MAGHHATAVRHLCLPAWAAALLLVVAAAAAGRQRTLPPVEATLQLGHRLPITCLSTTRRGDLLLTGSYDHTLSLWDVRSRVQLRTISLPEPVGCCAIAPDGSFLVGCAGSLVSVWDGSASHPLRSWHAHDYVGSVAVSSDGNTLITGEPTGRVEGWSRRTGQRLFAASVHKGPVMTVCLLSADRLIASAGETDGRVRILSARDGRVIRDLPLPSDLKYGLALSPDGSLLAVIGDSFKWWLVSTNTWKVVRSIAAPTNGDYSVVFSPDGRRVVVGLIDGSVWIWSVSGTLERTIQPRFHDHPVWPGSWLATSASSDLLLFADDTVVGSWQLAKGVREKDFAGYGRHLADATLISGGGLLSLDDSGGAMLWRRDVPPAAVVGGRPEVNAVCLAEDGSAFARAWGGVVSVFARGDRDWSLSVFDGNHRVGALALSRGGELLAIAEREYDTVKVWDARRGVLVRTLSLGWDGLERLSFAPDGNTLAIVGWNWSELWDYRTGNRVSGLDTPHGRVAAVAFSRDGSMVATGSSDGTVIVRRRPSGSVVRTMRASAGRIVCLAFSADDSWLAAGAEDNGLNVWRLDGTGKAERLTGHRSFVTGVRFGADDRALVSASADGSVRLWRRTGTGFRAAGTLYPLAGGHWAARAPASRSYETDLPTAVRVVSGIRVLSEDAASKLRARGALRAVLGAADAPASSHRAVR